jgi:hypothetical protein
MNLLLICSPDGVGEMCDVAPHHHITFLRIQSLGDDWNAVTLSSVKRMFLNKGKIEGIWADRARVFYTTPSRVFVRAVPEIVARTSVSDRAEVFTIPAGSVRQFAAGPGWTALEFNPGGCFEATSLGVTFRQPFLVEFKKHMQMVGEAKDPQLVKGEYLHKEQRQTTWGWGVDLGVLDSNAPLSIELLVEPFEVQAPNATIFSNHGNGYTGLTIEQEGTSLNTYLVAIGNGGSYLPLAHLQLTPLKRHYISLQLDRTEARVYLDGHRAGEIATPYVLTSLVPMRIGNWAAGDRAFSGRISEIAITKGTRREHLIQADAVRIQRVGKPGT